MKTQIKLTALILALVMIMGMCFAVSAEAPIKLEVKIDGEVLPGTTVTAYVYLTGSDIKAAGMSPVCESDIIEIVEAKWTGVILEDATMNEHWKPGEIAAMAFDEARDFDNEAVLKITFNVKEDAVVGTEFILGCTDVSVAVLTDGVETVYEAESNTDKVSVASVTGTVETEEEPILYGDVNGDGVVNAKDRTYLARYLTEWTGYDESTVNVANADVNVDGVVNAKDRTILARYLTEWTGYETLPYVK